MGESLGNYPYLMGSVAHELKPEHAEGCSAYDPRMPDARHGFTHQAGGAILSQASEVVVLRHKITHTRIREILEPKNNNSSPALRRASLITYAHFGEFPETTVGTSIGIDPSAERLLQREDLYQVLDKGEPIIVSWLRDKYDMDYLQKESSRYDSVVPALYNLERINRMTGHLHYDVAFALCAVRLIVIKELGDHD